MRWPFNPNLDRTTRGAAKSRKPHDDLTEKRGDRMLPVILHVTNASAARTIRPKNGVGPGLSGHDFLLETWQAIASLRTETNPESRCRQGHRGVRSPERP